MLKTLPSIKRLKGQKEFEPKKSTLDFLTNYSKSVEAKKTSKLNTMLIHLN